MEIRNSQVEMEQLSLFPEELTSSLEEHPASSEIITGFKKNKWGNFVVKGACGWYDAKHLLENFTAYGSPCGVFEHIENGEWVK